MKIMTERMSMGNRNIDAVNSSCESLLNIFPSFYAIIALLFKVPDKWGLLRGWGGGGGTLIFHTYVGSGHFWGFKILNFYRIFWVFQKNV